MLEVVASRYSVKKLSKKSCKTHKEKPVLGSLSNNVTGLQTIKLATLLKIDSGTDVSEPAVSRCSTKKVFVRNSQNLQEIICVVVSF